MSEQTENLAPCPFCGSHEVYLDYHNGYYTLCRKCGSGASTFDGDKREVIARWNFLPGLKSRGKGGYLRILAMRVLQIFNDFSEKR